MSELPETETEAQAPVIEIRALVRYQRGGRAFLEVKRGDEVEFSLAMSAHMVSAFDGLVSSPYVLDMFSGLVSQALGSSGVQFTGQPLEPVEPREVVPYGVFVTVDGTTAPLPPEALGDEDSAEIFYDVVGLAQRRGDHPEVLAAAIHGWLIAREEPGDRRELVRAGAVELRPAPSGFEGVLIELVR